MTLVVCEDDKDLLGLIELIVSGMDINLIKCIDDNSLREVMAQDTAFDLLLIDYWLKQNKADTVIKEIQGSHPNLPIIIMSAITNLPEVTAMLKVNDYLKKPFDIELFKSKINKYTGAQTPQSK
jgi:DNA-binding NtrC family response regulator